MIRNSCGSEEETYWPKVVHLSSTSKSTFYYLGSFRKQTIFNEPKRVKNNQRCLRRDIVREDEIAHLTAAHFYHMFHIRPPISKSGPQFRLTKTCRSNHNKGN